MDCSFAYDHSQFDPKVDSPTFLEKFQILKEIILNINKLLDFKNSLFNTCTTSAMQMHSYLIFDINTYELL